MIINNLVIFGRRSLVDAMNDPWDVKSVRKSGQYLSCMKINGVPLLPPVLSKECRKEMQYYKLLAREVEKRIALLKPYTLESDTEDVEEASNAQDQDGPESPQSSPETSGASKTPPSSPEISLAVSTKPDLSIVTQMDFCNLTSTCEDPPNSKLMIDYTLDLIGAKRPNSDANKVEHDSQIEIPERDCESPIKTKEKELLVDTTLVPCPNEKLAIMDTMKSFVDNLLTDPYAPLKQDGPSSLSSKSFTGSLNDLHTESLKESQKKAKLIRQRSYTLLEPSPQLLAHLEVQSLNTGVEMTNISMSESLSNLSSPNKKRRSWDLESAKVKWSSMALELNKKNGTKLNGLKQMLGQKCAASPTSGKKATPNAPRSKSVSQEKPRQSSVVSKTMTRSESAPKVVKKPPSPVRNTTSVTSNRQTPKETTSPKNTLQKKDTSLKPIISESDDPATKVRELFEKIQKQQQAQMASLVEKQKREQLLLQQVFDEQRNLLFKQLKTICPKSPLEAKEAWVDKVSDSEKGPVSLSQLINQKSPEMIKSPVPALMDTHNYINQCDEVLKRSRDITGSLKKQYVPKSQNGAKTSPCNGDGSITRTHSPTYRSASRKLNYDTSNASDREYEPLLTERSSDTLADLNVTFPSDNSEEAVPYHQVESKQSSSKPSNVYSSHLSNKQSLDKTNIDVAIRNMEESLYKQIIANNDRQNRLRQKQPSAEPTAREREAATRIVAAAKGYLVRRLMRTERVQATVQTIRDALVCALQLHQDRSGIRGADVDLHRRLIQQITSACYTLHDTFVASTPAERCAAIAADRGRQRALAARVPPRPRSHKEDVMSQSHSGSFPSRIKRPPTSPMSRSSYETFSTENVNATRYTPPVQRKPWR